MPYNPAIHHRRSIRLKGYDYTQSGAYFVILVTQGRDCLFGDVANDEMQLNDAGRMVQSAWEALPQRFPGIELDEYRIMPNHTHGIIVVVGATLVVAHDAQTDVDRAGTSPAPTTIGDGVDNVGATLVVAQDVRMGADWAGTSPAPTLGDIVGAFKSITTHEYIRGVYESGWPPFDKRVWQRNYFEHIIRNERELDHIREYILNNPLKWVLDREHPNAKR